MPCAASPLACREGSDVRQRIGRQRARHIDRQEVQMLIQHSAPQPCPVQLGVTARVLLRAAALGVPRLECERGQKEETLLNAISSSCPERRWWPHWPSGLDHGAGETCLCNRAGERSQGARVRVTRHRGHYRAVHRAPLHWPARTRVSAHQRRERREVSVTWKTELGDSLLSERAAC
eukprot:scaffold61343_cov35-Phaeocystis_antarctica.AAC.1